MFARPRGVVRAEYRSTDYYDRQPATLTIFDRDEIPNFTGTGCRAIRDDEIMRTCCTGTGEFRIRTEYDIGTGSHSIVVYTVCTAVLLHYIGCGPKGSPEVRNKTKNVSTYCYPKRNFVGSMCVRTHNIIFSADFEKFTHILERRTTS